MTLTVAALDDPKLPVRFWAKVAKGEPDECWEWTGTRNKAGYGSITVQGKTARTHRVSFLLAKKRVPTVVMHRCDNPPCVNPAHLKAGTIRLNNFDALVKGRRGFFAYPQPFDENDLPDCMTMSQAEAARLTRISRPRFASWWDAESNGWRLPFADRTTSYIPNLGATHTRGRRISCYRLSVVVNGEAL